MSHTSKKTHRAEGSEAKRHGIPRARGRDATLRTLGAEVWRLRATVEPLADHVAAHEELLHELDHRVRRLEDLEARMASSSGR